MPTGRPEGEVLGSKRGKPGFGLGSSFVQRLHELHLLVSSLSLPAPRLGNLCPQGLSVLGAIHSFLPLHLPPPGCTLTQF